MRRPRQIRSVMLDAAACSVLGIGLGVVGVACGGDGGAASDPVRAYTISLRAEDAETHYTYTTDDDVDIRVGDRVTFAMANDGTLIHDLAVVDADGTELGSADPVAAGGNLQLTVDFAEPGRYMLRCDVDDHFTKHDMRVYVEVTEPDPGASS